MTTEAGRDKSLKVITQDHVIATEIAGAATFEAWIAGYAPTRYDGQECYVLTCDSMHEIFDAIRGAKSSRLIGFTSGVKP
jgi:aspartate/glutamate racemase